MRNRKRFLGPARRLHEPTPNLIREKHRVQTNPCSSSGYLYSTAARRVQFTAADLLLGQNGVYREIWTFRITQNAAITTQVDTFTGTWNFGTVVNTLTFSAVDENGPFTINATWDGVRTVSMSVDGEPWVYRK